MPNRFTLPTAAGPAEPVPRSALAARMAESAARLTVVRAPAGFGKTTLMRQCRQQLLAGGTDTAWLAVGEADNDVTRFLARFAAAVSGMPAEGADAGAPLDALESLHRRRRPFVVFVDDLEHIVEPAVFALLRATVERLPPAGRIVIGSRSLPDVGLPRLRAHGELLELDADALRFTPDETRQYLRRFSALSAAALERLHGKTEGWAAALWLAALALERQGDGAAFVESFSGTNRGLADYLAEDVLARQPPAVRDFLLRTSILQRLDPAVCRALVPQADAEAVLRRLDEQGLFLSPLPGDEGSYRVHGLFADFLRQRLRREQPQQIAALHQAASAWYAGHGRMSAAIDHAVQAGDAATAFALLEDHAQRLAEQGRMRLLAHWFDALPPAELHARPLLEALAVWATLFTQGPWRAEQRLQASGAATSADARVRAHANAQRPLLLAMQDRYEEALAAGRDSLARLPSGNQFVDSVLCSAMANVFTVMGDRQAAKRMIDDARRLQGRSAFNRMYAESLDGMLDLQQGRLREAAARYRVALTASGPGGSFNYLGGNAWAGVLYAATLYETNDLAAADHLMGIYLPLANEVGLPDHMISGHVMRARMAFHRGEVEQAFETVTALEYLGHHRQLPRVVAAAKLERSRLRLLQGDAQAATEELDRADDPQVWKRAERLWLPAHAVDYLALARLRWQIHFGDARSTVDALAREHTEATRQRRARRAMRVGVLHALALQRSSEPAAAVEVMAGVVRQASHEGFLRLIADEGPAAGRLVRRYRDVLLETPAKRSDPGLLVYLERLLAAFGPLPAEAGSSAAPGSLMEPLTRKELQVLQLVAEGCSNNTIAERLGLSDSTVRTHLRSINTKVGARSRAEAVAIARRLDVVR